MLVVMLVACMVIPAMAASDTDVYGQYTYKWSVTNTSTSGQAHITTPYVPTTVGAAVQNRVYVEGGIYGYAFLTAAPLGEWFL